MERAATGVAHPVVRSSVMSSPAPPRRPSAGAIAALLAGCGVMVTVSVHAATFTVDTTSDSAALSACTAAPADCSLRGAIVAANATPAVDDIAFAIPSSDGGCALATGMCRIQVAADFPLITQPLTIDGYSQPGAQPNTIPAPGANNAQLRIEITNAPGFPLSNALFQVNASTLELRGLAVFLPSNGMVAGAGNPVVIVRGSWFGVDAAGQTPAYTGSGTVLNMGSFHRRIVIGGPDPADRNVIAGSGRDLAGQPGGGINTVRVNSTSTTRAELRVQGNLVGLAPDGITALPFRDPLLVSTGDDAFETPDIRIQDNRFARPPRNFGCNCGGALRFNTSRTMTEPALIRGNVFGLAVDGSRPGVQGDHIEVFLGNNSRVPRVQVGGLLPGEGNTFAAGLRLNAGVLGSAVRLPNGSEVSTFVEFAGNAMLGNDGIGVDGPHPTAGGGIALGRTLNDPGDADGGANNLQNFPQISAFAPAGGQFQVSYLVDSATGNSAYPLRVDFYRALGDEGEVLLDSDVYGPADAQTVRSVTLPVPPGVTLGAGDVLVAVATDAEGRSSEFSFGTLANLSVSTGPGPFFDIFGLIVQVTAVATGGPFRPNGEVLVSINTSPAVTCTATLAPAAAALTSTGSCVLAPTLQPGSRTVTATYDAVRGAFASATGGNVVATTPVTILADRIFAHDFELP
jgi:hypothetical protein